VHRAEVRKIFINKKFATIHAKAEPVVVRKQGHNYLFAPGLATLLTTDIPNRVLKYTKYAPKSTVTKNIKYSSAFSMLFHYFVCV